MRPETFRGHRRGQESSLPTPADTATLNFRAEFASAGTERMPQEAAATRPDDASMHRAPEPILFIARTHVVMGGVILFFTVMLYALLRDSTVLELSRRTYAITITLGVLYLLTALLVWRGWPVGRPLNYVCSLLYLSRPPLGLRIWKIMRSAEFREHFQRKSKDIGLKNEHSEPKA